MKECKNCGKSFEQTSKHRVYCSSECANFVKKKRQKVADAKWYLKNSAKFRRAKNELICKSCGRKFYGHGNAKYCDSCLDQNNGYMRKLRDQRKVLFE